MYHADNCCVLQTYLELYLQHHDPRMLEPAKQRCDQIMATPPKNENDLDFTKPNIHRSDKDFAVAWAKMYGKGRVFYSTFGHADEAWDNPQVQKMYLEAVKWAMRLQGDDVKPGRAAASPR